MSGQTSDAGRVERRNAANRRHLPFFAVKCADKPNHAVKGNTDPRFFAPNNTAFSLDAIGQEKVKTVGNSDLAIHLNVCATTREIMDGAIDS